MKKTICLSAGHGAGDPGVVYQGLQEDDLTRRITKRAVEMIRKHGVDCLEVPDNLTLVETIQWINNRTNQIDIAVEVHINSGVKEATGVEGWNYAGGPNESDLLSKFLADAVAAETGLKNRGVIDESQNRYKKLGFIHDTNPIAALIEVAFIQGDYSYLSKDENITTIAKGVARGCLQYCGYRWTPEVLNPEPAKDYKALYESVLLANKGLDEALVKATKELAEHKCPTPTSQKDKAEKAIDILQTIE